MFGVDDAKYREEVCAWVQLKQGAVLSTEALKYVEFVEGYPMTVTGKIQKFKIREVMSEKLS